MRPRARPWIVEHPPADAKETIGPCRATNASKASTVAAGGVNATSNRYSDKLLTLPSGETLEHVSTWPWPIRFRMEVGSRANLIL